MNSKIEHTEFIKTIYVLPEDTTILFVLSGHKFLSAAMTSLNDIEDGYSQRIDGFYITVLDEETLKLKNNIPTGIIINFHESKNEIEYSVAAKKTKENLFLLSEFLFSYQQGMNYLVAGGVEPEEPEHNNSIKFDKVFDIVKMAVFLDKKEDAEVVNIIYNLIKES